MNKPNIKYTAPTDRGDKDGKNTGYKLQLRSRCLLTYVKVWMLRGYLSKAKAPSSNSRRQMFLEPDTATTTTTGGRPDPVTE